MNGEKDAQKQPAEPRPYKPRIDPAWVEDVDGWEWKEREAGSYAKAGFCPSCKHQIGFVERPLVYAHLSLDAAEEFKRPDRRFHACNCEVAHPDAAEGMSGCGAGGQILVPGAPEAKPGEAAK